MEGMGDQNEVTSNKTTDEAKAIIHGIFVIQKRELVKIALDGMESFLRR